MGTHTIPEKVRAKVNRMFEGPDKERTIKNLEVGKTIHIGGVKLRGVKAEKADGGGEKSAPTAAAASLADSSGKPDKGVKDK